MNRDADPPGDATPIAGDDIPVLLSRLREERTDHLIRIATRSTGEADSADERR